MTAPAIPYRLVVLLDGEGFTLHSR
jgi:hypothetical protein